MVRLALTFRASYHLIGYEWYEITGIAPNRFRLWRGGARQRKHVAFGSATLSLSADHFLDDSGIASDADEEV